MPGCCAMGCTNSAKKGFTMKCFPRDPERRKIWANNVERKNWEPTNYSYLCEVHFEDDMWEKVRVDGKTKLKLNAVPTLFSSKKVSAHCKRPKNHSISLLDPLSSVLNQPSTSIICVKDPLETSPKDDRTTSSSVLNQPYRNITCVKNLQDKSPKEHCTTSSSVLNQSPRGIISFKKFQDKIPKDPLDTSSKDDCITSSSVLNQSSRGIICIQNLQDKILKDPLDMSPKDDRTTSSSILNQSSRSIIWVKNLQDQIPKDDCTISSFILDQSSTSICVENPQDKSLNADRTISSEKTKETYIEQLQEKLAIYNRRFKVLHNQNKVYRKKLMVYQNKMKKFAQLIDEKHNNTLLKKFLNDDQICALKRKSTQYMKWSNETINKALKLKILCGNSGYDELLKQNIPLPSVRTLQRYLKNFQFENGILTLDFKIAKDFPNI